MFTTMMNRTDSTLNEPEKLIGKGRFSQTLKLFSLALATQSNYAIATIEEANPALAQLKDIVTPEPIGVWPIALGYVVLAFILIATSLGIALYLIRRQRRYAIIKLGISAIKSIEYDETKTALTLSSTLKRVVMHYVPREQVANLTGPAWLHWLKAQIPEHKNQHFEWQHLEKMFNQSYQPIAISQEDWQHAKTSAILWLKVVAPTLTCQPKHLQQTSVAQEFKS
ncbi:DUF4381 domain-containing protein [Shewanella gelidii]|uniref:DUF4381 domain-containing protein n=1 Tax=Shewanella gelidii TaxID=1642821 RepID=A0A917JTM8_9GAMM|nr:DUF4381 domain-containing protein [Shewanella gelidii]MCL1098220.1 DUF4381 domain-containing protein [Shewanella gelidii]GGI83514.1 hypothetical protein GCM10009332_20990 [Shewanella gelidii]